MENWFVSDSSITALLLACALGGFLGIRREIHARENKVESFIGFRTMMLISAFGAVSTFIPELPWLPALFFVGLMVLISVSYAYGSFKQNLIGLTTEISSFMIFWVGVLVGLGQPVIAILITLLLAGVNAYRDQIRNFAGAISQPEWDGALQLLFFSGAILPFLPNEAIDPWGMLVPFKIWLLVVFISGIGFLGYFLTKYIGVKGGIPAAAFLGAIVSSTAVTTSMAEQSKRAPGSSIFAVGIMIGVATMQVRVAITIALLGSVEIVRQTLVLPLVMALISALFAYLFFRYSLKEIEIEQTKKNAKTELRLASPFEIIPAIKFGGLFVLVLLALALAQRYFGNTGVYIAAALSGFVDVDAIILSSLESLNLGELSLKTVSVAIMIAIMVNTLVKILYTAVLGNKKTTKMVALGVSCTLFSGLLSVLLLSQI